MQGNRIIIIGAGLTGLALAYYLRDSGLNITIIEARSRIGGRILTKETPSGHRIEMGATWLGRKHRQLNELLQELDLGIFEQTLGQTAVYEPISTSPPQIVTLPPNHDPSYRIKNGSSSLIDKLYLLIKDRVQIELNSPVTSITTNKGGVEVKAKQKTNHGTMVISTLPPNLLFQSIDLSPPLPDATRLVVSQTHTWMGDSIKIGFTYKEPFWRSNNLSGTIVSNVVPIPEMYDHTDHLNKYHSLKGFLNSAYYSLSQSDRIELCLKQLEKYYGTVARNYISYEEAIWSTESYTFSSYDNPVLPHQNIGHEIYHQSYCHNRLIIAGSETAQAHPGYMEGAVSSAKSVSQQLLRQFI